MVLRVLPVVPRGRLGEARRADREDADAREHGEHEDDDEDCGAALAPAARDAPREGPRVDVTDGALYHATLERLGSWMSAVSDLARANEPPSAPIA